MSLSSTFWVTGLVESTPIAEALAFVAAASGRSVVTSSAVRSLAVESLCRTSAETFVLVDVVVAAAVVGAMVLLTGRNTGCSTAATVCGSAGFTTATVVRSSEVVTPEAASLLANSPSPAAEEPSLAAVDGLGAENSSGACPGSTACVGVPKGDGELAGTGGCTNGTLWSSWWSTASC